MREYSYSIKRKSLHKKYRRRVKRKRKSHGRSFYTITLITFCTLLFTTIFSGLYFASYLKSRVVVAESADIVLAEIPQASEIYDRNGKLLFRLHGDHSNTDKAKISEITNITRAAFLAAEDANFYNHDGSSEEAIIRCSLNILQSKPVCGGSTITQQLVKITTKKNDPSIDRKVDELILAKNVEEKYSKEQILEQYFNVTPYGSNITGIKTASKFYFGISDLSKLNLAQSVVLASIINDPVILSPTLSSDKEKAAALLDERINYVYTQLELKLEVINEQLRKNSPEAGDLLTQEMITEARNFKISYKDTKTDIRAGHFVNYVMDELQEKNFNGDVPFTLSQLQNGGYRIYTTLDYDLQKIAEKYVAKGGNDYRVYNVYNAAVMTTVPSTGEIITMAGSKGFKGKSEGCDSKGKNCKYDPEVNVLESLQSPGSTNKPLAYYLGYESGLFAPGSFLPDIPIRFGSYQPKNWDSRFLGATYSTTAREMLRQSRNMPALMMVDIVGYGKYIDKAREFGYTTYKNKDQYGQSIVLGGADVYPLEHAQAYGVFANQGDLVMLNPILRIEDSNGNIVYKRKNNKKRVADPAASFLLNQSLMNLPTGTGNTIGWGDGREVAGKTGTTQDNKDSLLVMYSPEFVTIGWSGNNNNENLNQLWGWPGFITAPWMRDYMSEIGGSKYFDNKTPFAKPDNVYYGGGYCNRGGSCLPMQRDWLIIGKEPTTAHYRLPSVKFQAFLNEWNKRRTYRR
jgi:penicillin-binding protein 1A